MGSTSNALGICSRDGGARRGCHGGLRVLRAAGAPDSARPRARPEPRRRPGVRRGAVAPDLRQPGECRRAAGRVPRCVQARASAASGAEAHQPRILRPGHVRLSRGSPCLAAGLFPRARGLCCRAIRRDAALFVLRGGAGGLPRRRAVDVPRSLRSHSSDVVSPWQPRVQAAFDHGSASIQLDHDDRDSAAHERHAPRR